MQVLQSNFDPETVALMGRACDEAWREVQSMMFFPSPEDSEDVHRQLAGRVMAAVAAGERDPVRLAAVALDGVEA